MPDKLAGAADGALTLSLANDPGQVRLTVDAASTAELNRLIIRFRSGRHLGPISGQIELDDFLANVSHLASWPRGTPVIWEDALASLVRDGSEDRQSVARALATEGPETDTHAITDLGENWKGNLTAFQRRDIERLLALRHGANFSVPGAGKTRVSLAVFSALKRTAEVEQLLIVGPKSSYSAWFSENEECFNTPIRMERWGDQQLSTMEAAIINYERLQGAMPALNRWMRRRPTMLILDEAHRMKLGAEGVYGAACLALGPVARRRLILTGTPAPNGTRDLENLFSFVWPGFGKREVVRAVSGGDLAQASHRLKPLFTRTTKSELGLPEVSVKQTVLELPRVHREIYDALLGQYSSRVVSNQDDFEALGKIMVYMMMASTSPALLAVGTSRYEPLSYRVPPLAVPSDSGLFELLKDLPSYELSPKFQEVIAIVRANAKRGRKTLVWSTFIRSLTTLQQLLSAFSPAIVHGGTQDRDGEIHRFKNDPDCFVLLSNPATLGEGISLHHACHDAVYVDRDFAAGRYIQSVDRIHRLGLPDDVDTNVTVLLSEGTIDEVIAERLSAKVEFMSSVLDDPDVQQLGDLEEVPPIGSSLDNSDLRAIVEHFSGRSG